MVVVLVIGEIVRLVNFLLYGYFKLINLKLEKEFNLLILKNIKFCIIYIMGFLKCILFFNEVFVNEELLLIYLIRYGVDV